MLKESDLIEGHEYISKNARIIYDLVISRRKILNINKEMGCVTYGELKVLKQGVKGRMKTISIKSFLRWAVKDITHKKNQG
ncbi:hypothetical protein [Pasteurella multocida]|uniref:hypothetical protein n=1 Tax=Pasteurella multocida TaxID=747 RepID=UPI00293127E7|nr:hypothetical protein [Pasteurella multocida]WNY75950.1 hypothetical protein H2513_08710 [Pasteurella multocida]